LRFQVELFTSEFSIPLDAGFQQATPDTQTLTALRDGHLGEFVDRIAVMLQCCRADDVFSDPREKNRTAGIDHMTYRMVQNFVVQRLDLEVLLEPLNVEVAEMCRERRLEVEALDGGLSRILR